MAAAPAFQPFTIRGFAAGMRAVDASKCWPFGRGGGDGEPPPPLPPMEPPKRSRWWAHELAAERARLESRATVKEDAGGAVGGRGGSGNGKGMKRKGSRGRVRAERAWKRQRSLQFGLLSKRKEKTSSRLLHYVLRKQLLSKHKGSTLRTPRELSARKKFQNTHDCMSTHGNSLNKQYMRGMDPSGVSSNLVRKKAANSPVNKQNMKASEPTIYPLNPGCELVKNVTYPPKDDIFGDLPLLESSKIMFHTGVDELPTVIEDSFVSDQSGADAISENVSLKLIPPSDMSVQTSSTLEDLVKKEGTPAKKSIFISQNDAKKSLPSAEFDGLNHSNINMVKTCLNDTRLKSTDVLALSSYSNKGLKSGCSNTASSQQDCFSVNTNYCQEISKPGTSFTTSSVTVRTRTEAIESDRDTAVNSKKGTSISCALVPTECHISSEGSVLSSALSQGSASAATSADGMSSCKRIPSQDSIPASGLIGKFASNMCHENRKSDDTCTSLSKEDQGSWYSKLHPVCTPASIGSAFMKLPGLERIEISSCNLKTDENMTTNGRSANIVRCEKQQVVIGVPNIMQTQRKTGFSDSQVQEKKLNGYLRQNVYHPCQPTVRLMGKTVSVCERSKEHRVSTMGKVWTDNTIIDDRPSSTSCHFLHKRLFPCQASVTPRAHVNELPDILSRIPSTTLPEARATIGNVQNQRLQPVDIVSSTVRDCIWNIGNQSVHQAEVKKSTTINVDSRARHIDLHQLPQAISTSQNRQCQLSTPSIRGKECNVLGPAVIQSSSFPQWVLTRGIQEKYQKPTLFSYDDPSSAPIYQSCQVPGTKLSSTSIISFLDYGTDNAEFSRSLPQACPSLTTSLPINFVSTVSPTCTIKPANTGCRKGAVFTNQRSKRPAYINNVAHEPAKKLMAHKQDLMAPVFGDTKNHSLGWSLDDAIGPRILDFGSKVAGHGLEMSINETNSVRASSGPVPVLETRSMTGNLAAGARAMLKPDQTLNDHSKLLFSTFSVDNSINSAVL